MNNTVTSENVFTCDVSSGSTGINIWNTYFAGKLDLSSNGPHWLLYFCKLLIRYFVVSKCDELLI